MNTTIEKQTIGEAAPAAVMLPVTAIIPDPRNRKGHDEERLKLLAESIAGEGLLQAIVVRPMPPEYVALADGVTHMIIAGERRWRAHKLLGRDVIAAVVVESDDHAKAVRRRAAENMHRENLSPVEEGTLCQELIETGMKQADVAAFMGYGAASTVANQVRLLKLPAAVAKLVHEGKLSRAHGVALVKWADWPKHCLLMAEEALKDETSAKEIERSSLPYSWELEKRKLVTRFSKYDDYSWTAAMGADRDWLQFAGTYYCLDYTKGMEEKKRQDAARQAVQLRKAAKQAKLNAQGEKTPEQLERAQQREKKKALRAALAVRLQELVVVLAGKSGADAQLWRYLGPRLMQGFGSKCIGEAAAVLGLTLPKGMTGGWYGVDSKSADSITADEWQRLTIYTAAHKACADHAKWHDQGEPEMITTLLGKQTRPASVPKKQYLAKRAAAIAGNQTGE